MPEQRWGIKALLAERASPQISPWLPSPSPPPALVPSCPSLPASRSRSGRSPARCRLCCRYLNAAPVAGERLAGAGERGLCRFKAHVILSRAGMCWNRLRHLQHPTAAHEPPPSSPPVRSRGCAARTRRLLLALKWPGSCRSSQDRFKGLVKQKGILGNDLKVKMRRFPPLKPWPLFWRQSESSDVFFTLETGFVTKNLFFFSYF